MVDMATWLQWIPVVLFVVGVHIKSRRDMQTEVGCLKRELSAFKLEVAKEYVSVSHLKEVEDRIMRLLTRIEDKLDHFKGGHE